MLIGKEVDRVSPVLGEHVGIRDLERGTPAA